MLFLSARHSERESLCIPIPHLTGGQKRSVASSVRDPILPPTRHTSGLSLVPAPHPTAHHPKRRKQNKSLYSIFYFATNIDDLKVVVILGLKKKKKRFEVENKFFCVAVKYKFLY